tara:strand:- start:72 stop:1301 length:1230 start_codon:yes stop_codon:yes gene_type:complete
MYAHAGAGSNMHMAANSVYEGTAPNYYDKYLTSSTASKYVQDSGFHIWSTAASGTAGNAITWSERMRIDSSGNVGINMTAPNSGLHVNGSITSSNLGQDASTSKGLSLQGYGESSYINMSGAGNLIFRMGSTFAERMRIDSSGNLLVGTTDTTVYDNNSNTTADNGLNLRGDGKLDAARYNSIVLGLNRTGNDGTIVDFRKSGATVGSIASQSGPIAAYLGSSYATIGAGDTGLFFNPDNDHIVPVIATSSATKDNAIDLGASSGRFKDLYLSGGAYLGGTGAANLLDDYEEGSGTPVVGASVSGTVTIAAGSRSEYTKIGNQVHFQFEFQVTATGTGAIKVTLPFTAYGYAAGSLRAYLVTFSGTSPFIETVPSQGFCYFMSNSSGNVTASIMSTGYYYGEITYTTSL